jgi:thiamine-monophosphate kinase
MNKENYFIQQISKDSKSVIGDDGAFIDGFVYSQDAFFENAHFKKEWFTLEQIAIKSMLVNISDAIAMNAKPIYAILTVAIPKCFTKNQLKELANGFTKIAKKYHISIIGGDTIANSKLDISVTIISKTKKPIYRTGMKKGHIIAYTGTLGESKKDLNRLFQNKPIRKNSKFIKPILRDDFFYKIANLTSSAMDISDGLFFELERLSKANRLGFKLFDKIPKDIGTSGEEYEMLFSFDKKHLQKIKNLAKKYKVKLNIIGYSNRGKFINRYKNHHF